MILRGLRTVHAYAVLWFGLGLFGLVSLVWGAVAVPLRALLPERTGHLLGRRAIARAFRAYLATLQALGACRFDLQALDTLREAGPMILAPNHPSLLDAVMLLSRAPQASCVLKAPLIDGVLFGPGARLAGYIRNDWPVGMVRRAVEELRGGSQLLLFPEGTRTTRGRLNPFRGSISLIARQAGVPVQTVFIEADSAFLGKGWPLWRRPELPLRYRVRLGRRFDPPRELHGFMRELEQYCAREMAGETAASLPMAVDVESRPA